MNSIIISAMAWASALRSSVVESLRREEGQDLIEYALLGGLIAAAIIAVIALGTMTTAITDLAAGVGDCIDFDSTTPCGPA